MSIDFAPNTNPDSQAYEMGKNLSFDVEAQNEKTNGDPYADLTSKDASYMVAATTADRLRADSGVKLHLSDVEIAPEDHARGVGNVVGQFGKGMVEQVTQRPLETGMWAAVGFAGAAGLKALSARLPLAGKVAGYGLLGLAGLQLVEAIPRWSKDVSIAYDPSGLTLSEVERAEKGIRGIGSGTVNLIAGGLLTPAGTRFAEAPKVALKLDAYENSVRSMLGLPGRPPNVNSGFGRMDQSAYGEVAPNGMARLIREYDGVSRANLGFTAGRTADVQGPRIGEYDGVSTVKHVRFDAGRDGGDPRNVEARLMRLVDEVSPLEAAVGRRVQSVLPGEINQDKVALGLSKFIDASVKSVLGENPNLWREAKLRALMADNMSPSYVKAAAEVLNRTDKPDLLGEPLFMRSMVENYRAYSADTSIPNPMSKALDKSLASGKISDSVKVTLPPKLEFSESGVVGQAVTAFIKEAGVPKGQHKLVSDGLRAHLSAVTDTLVGPDAPFVNRTPIAMDMLKNVRPQDLRTISLLKKYSPDQNDLLGDVTFIRRLTDSLDTIKMNPTSEPFNLAVARTVKEAIPRWNTRSK